MIKQELKERIESARAAKARHAEMQKQRERILEGGEKAQAALTAAQARHRKAEDIYQTAVTQSSEMQEEPARAELLEARAELEQAQDRLKAFESKQGDLLSHLGERSFMQARSEVERCHELAWNAIADAELERFPRESLDLMKRAWAASWRSGNFTEYLAQFLAKHCPSESERKALRVQISEEFEMTP